jgi:prepilin-type N-terminal cleavage/methylation domain-containing protein
MILNFKQEKLNITETEVDNMKRLTQSGFTLIELLIVIVILGILTGVVLAVINPTAQQARANQAVLRSNVEKACIALQACANSTIDATRCGDSTAIGYTLVNGTPSGSTYTLTFNPSPVAAASTITFQGAIGTCTMSCMAKPSDGTFTNLTVSANCVL